MSLAMDLHHEVIRLRAALQASEEARAELNAALDVMAAKADGDEALGKALREAREAWGGAHRLSVSFDPGVEDEDVKFQWRVTTSRYNASARDTKRFEFFGVTELEALQAAKAAALSREPGRGGADGR